MNQITIDGKVFKAGHEDTILSIARKAGIDIPTLCHQEWTEPYGGCRLCSVEITKESWNGWRKVVTACNHPAHDGLIVYTSSERIIAIRKTLLDLLLARCPNTPAVQNLAGKYGITKTSFVEREKADDCILCGLCVRACEVIGSNAISTTHRGIEKKIDTPFAQVSDDCIGCACCAQVCPTHHIRFQETQDVRTIWNKNFKMVKCSSCGRSHITEAQMNHFIEKSNLPRSYFEKCEICHKKETAQTFLKMSC